MSATAYTTTMSDYEKYEVEAAPFTEGVGKSRNIMEEYEEKLNLYESIEQMTSQLLADIKNPQNHNAPAIIGFNDAYERILESYTEKREIVAKDLEEGYTIKIGDLEVAISQIDIDIWDYRIRRAGEWLDFLTYNMYRADIVKYIESEEEKIQGWKDKLNI